MYHEYCCLLTYIQQTVMQLCLVFSQTDMKKDEEKAAEADVEKQEEAEDVAKAAASQNEEEAGEYQLLTD